MKKIIIIVCAIVVLSTGAIIAANICVKDTPYKEWDAFVSSSESGEKCKTIVKENNGEETVVEYDGSQYYAKRSDGTDGRGKYLICLTGRLPQVDRDISYTIICDKKYSFEEVSNDILGLTQSQLDYFLVK